MICLYFIDCIEGDIRLIPIAGYHKGIGLLEVCINGTWGTICSDFFDDNDAMVTCRHLGYSPLGKSVYFSIILSNILQVLCQWVMSVAGLCDHFM